MLDKIFFDTNIQVYLFDLTEAKKRESSIQLLKKKIGNSRLIISTQVINEFINVTSRLIEHKVSHKQILAKLDFINNLFIVVPLRYSTSLLALSVQEKYSFSFWDSLIIASAIENNCNLLYREDLQHNQKIESLIIQNPFQN
ncbi:tRNA(fMet)-specific endonuclease VapC [bacterium BMS3Abin04]|nr:tRNA(fMet)-specific endonuclease VapC [bacterium BMS3Abin04]